MEPHKAKDTEFDAIVCGASLAGCTAATFLARRGLRVALIERAREATAYKKVCTHFIQPSATPTLQRLGVADQIEAAGGVRNSTDMYTRFGWTEHPIDQYGYSIRREVLDPIVRRTAAETPGVELRLGHTVTGLVYEDERIVGVKTESHDDKKHELRAQIVVAADGRHSKVGQLAGIPVEQAPNNRFMYWAYFSGLRMPHGERRSLYWLLDPDAAYCFPNENGLVLVAVQPHKDKLPEYRKDLEGNFLRFFQNAPHAPNLRSGKRETEFRGMLEMPNHVRTASAPGLAFIGDAALTADPLFGVGCGWALQSGEWLANTVAEALLSRQGIDEALASYRALHAAQIRGHHDLINMASKAEKFNAIEKILFIASAKDRNFARDFGLLNTRISNPKDVIGLKFLARAIWASVAKRGPARAERVPA